MRSKSMKRQFFCTRKNCNYYISRPAVAPLNQPLIIYLVHILSTWVSALSLFVAKLIHRNRCGVVCGIIIIN